MADEREHRDRRELILEQALELFAAHGYAGAGMRALARAAGIREATLYHYFPTKEALMEALIAHHRPPPNFFRDQFPRGLPLPELLAGAAIGFVEAMRLPENQRFLRVMLVEAHHHAGWARAYLDTVYEPPVEALTEVLTGAGAANPRWVAESFTGALLNYVIHHLFLAPSEEAQSQRIAYLSWLAEQTARWARP